MNQNPTFNGTGRFYDPSRGWPPAEDASGFGGMQLALAATCVFLSPFNIFRLDAFYFTASDAAAIAALLVAGAGGTLSFASVGAGTFLWNIGLVLLTGTLLSSSLLFGDPARGFILSGQYLFAYLVLSHVILSRPWRETVLLLKAFVASVALMCLHGIYVIDVRGEVLTQFVSGSGRLLGFIERDNECAIVIAMAVPLALWLAGSGCMKKSWLVVLLPLLTYGIALTGSNTGVLSLFFALACFVLLIGSWRQIILAAGAAAALFSAALTWGSELLPEVFQRRVLGALESGNIDQAGTFTGRFELIQEAISHLDRVMLLGFGADQFREISKQGEPVHNMYLLVWTEAGFLGMAGFLLMLLGAVVAAVSAFRLAGGRLAAVCTLTSTTLFALLVNATPHVYGRFFVVPLLLAIAPSVASARQGRSPIPAARSARSRAREP